MERLVVARSLCMLVLYTTFFHKICVGVVLPFPCLWCDSTKPGSLIRALKVPVTPHGSTEPAPTYLPEAPELGPGLPDSPGQAPFALPQPSESGPLLPRDPHLPDLPGQVPVPLPESPVPGPALPFFPDWPDSPFNAPAPSPEFFVPDWEPVGVVFDVVKHGAVPDGGTECSMAFLAAWNAACQHPGNSTFFIPEGSYFIGPIKFSGPCRNDQSPFVKIKGRLIAPTELEAFPTLNWIEFRNLNGLVLSGGVGVTKIDAQGAVEAWKQVSCRKSIGCKSMVTSLKFCNISYGTIGNISLSNGKGFHVAFLGSKNITVRNITITAPWDSPNTDGIHISHSVNISIESSVIGVGDDCVSIGPGSINISVFDVKCGPGHGISIGSLGKYKNEQDVSRIHVYNCTINGTQNGIRVKTWPASPPSNAYNLKFENTAMINVSNPIIIDQQYCPSSMCDLSTPSLVHLSDIYIKNISGTYNTKSAVTLLCSSSVPCRNITLVDINLNHTIQSCTGAGHGGGDGSSSTKQGGLNVKGGISGLEVVNSSF